MNDTFVFYAEPAEVVSDGRRQIQVGLGEIGGLDLAYLGVGKEDVLLSVAELQELASVLSAIDPERAQRSSGYYLYRVVVTELPDGATGDVEDDWEPQGWDPGEDWVQRHGSRRFFWPSTKTEYRSKSSARARARLIESYGATTRIEQSSLITWPADDVEEW